jgi:hypothetical protein
MKIQWIMVIVRTIANQTIHQILMSKESLTR